MPAVGTGELVDEGHRLGAKRDRRVTPIARERPGCKPAAAIRRPLVLVDQSAVAGD
jgi:hypothetical protein